MQVRAPSLASRSSTFQTPLIKDTEIPTFVADSLVDINITYWGKKNQKDGYCTSPTKLVLQKPEVANLYSRLDKGVLSQP